MIVAVGTKNPAKVHAVQEALIKERVSVISVDVNSNVSSQPFSEEETLSGALNRARAALSVTEATLSFGLEGGVVETERGLMLCNWGALCHRDGGEWIASGAKIPLPSDVARRLRANEELGDIMKSITNDQDVHKRLGAVGWYTAGWVNRKELFLHIVKLLYGQYVATLKRVNH